MEEQDQVGDSDAHCLMTKSKSIKIPQESKSKRKFVAKQITI